MLQPVLDVFNGILVYQVQRCTSACLLDDLRKVFETIAECIGILSYRTVYAVVFGQHLYKLTQDIVGLFDAFFCIDCHF